ncbi:MAG TPA: TonB-dependent receptor [Gammaproteobacteria bacterium]|nr:TonB-dependent receptor [Gammaproteobacteria bacterium]
MKNTCSASTLLSPLFNPVIATALISLSLLSPSLQAQEQNAVIVTATRTAETVDDSLASVSVITRADIEKSQAEDVIDLLRLQSGIDIARNGGPGASTSLFLRGTNSNQTLVLIDGVRASSTTTGTFAWQHLNTSDIERIEIVRGPRAAQYGSDAIGGVIQIFTRKNKTAHLRVMGGSYKTALIEAGIGGGDKIKYSLNATGRSSEGFSRTSQKSSSYNADKDGYRDQSLSGNILFPLAGKTSLKVSGWYSKSNVEYDAYGGGYGVSDNSNSTLDVRLKNQTTAIWSQTLSAGLATDDSKDTSSSISRIKSQRVMADWQHDLTLSQNSLLSLGLSTYTDRASNVSISGNNSRFDESITNNAVFAILQSSVRGNDFSLSARVDDHERFGKNNTGQAAWAYNPSQKLRVLASYGTAFRAPDINELYYPNYGNPALNPEKSSTAELGLRYQLDPHQKLRINAYHTRITDMIQSVPIALYTYEATNIGKAKIDGLEIEHELTRGAWTLLSNFTLQKAIDDSDKSDLLRRPRQKLSMQLHRQLNKNGSIGMEWIYASARKDYGNVNLDAYNLVNLSARYPIHKGIWLDARLENLFDAHYQLVSNYNTPGRSLYIGINYVPTK